MDLLCQIHLRESDAITSWPPIFLSDITVFLMEDHPGKDVALHGRVMNEYKEGKAYRLYESGWLKEIYWRPISTASEFCFLKTNCTHTMKIGDTPHTAWITAGKKSGKIVSAYCTCVAGQVICLSAMFVSTNGGNGSILVEKRSMNRR